ncbi:MAG: dihydroxyacetone kinase subunit DhaK, partial [Spirochaetales bacterium]|nr:dihydroxyacetone kinase subunit DhaK [Spirochaetales bacterium]
IEEMLSGYVSANPDKIVRKAERVLARKEAPVAGKVGMVTGGGSGHKPALIGYLGPGMMDAVAVGNIFAAPAVQICYDAIKAADSGKGVMVCIGNYNGDIMNFGMAIDMLRDEGHKIEELIVNDDVASAPVSNRENRRGVAGEIILWKVLGAMADNGASLEEMKETGEKVIFNTRSLGVAHTPCIMPSSGKPSFELGPDEMEIGVGHHGEPGIERVKMMPANEITDLIMDKVLADLPFKSGDDVSVIVNGLGSTALLELYIIYNRTAEILKSKGISVYKAWVGEYFTSMEMGGFSITLTKLEDNMKKGVDHPIGAVHFR